MENILVIQLCRSGDLIQSTPAFGALRHRWPNAHISVLARSSFGNVLAGISEIDEVIEWDSSPLVQEWVAKPYGDRLALLRQFVKPLRTRKYHLVCNLSNDVPSALLAYLMRPRKTVGLTFCRDRRYRVKDEWSRYLFLATDLRRFNSLNLTDLLVHACEGGEHFPPRIHSSVEDAQAAERIMQQLPVGTGPLLGIQVGASADTKRWPLDNFRELASRLGARGASMLFFGTANERDQVGSIVDPLRRNGVNALNLAGETTFGSLAALVKRCKLLISNDTATAHVAAATDTPSLIITFATANAWDTGPYGEGHFVVEPEYPCYPCSWHSECPGIACRNTLSIDAIQAAVESALGSTVNGQALQNFPVIFSRSSWMPDGFLGLRPLNRPALAMKDVLRFLYRSYHLARLNRDGDPGQLSDWLDDYRIDDPLELSRQALAAAQDLAALRSMSEKGEKAAQVAFSGATSGIADAKRISDAIERLQQRILACEENHVLKFLVAGFRHNLVDMEARDGREAAAIHRWNYRTLSQGCGEIEAGLRAFASSPRMQEMVAG